MTQKFLLEKIKYQKIDKAPMVILPMKIWERILEHLEIIEMEKSKTFRKKIAGARAEKKLYSSKEIKKILGI